MSKIIKIESCAGCDIKEKYTKDTPFGEESRYFCPKLAKQIEWYITNKTLPDNCPLDDDKSLYDTYSQDVDLITLLQNLSTSSHGNELSIGNECVDNAIEDIVLYIEEARSEYAKYVLEKKTPQIRRDATKHIRVVSDWKPIINPYDFDVNELAILHNGLLEAIKADLKAADKEARG